MALLKPTTFKGVTAAYWKILYVSQDVISKKTTVGLGLYVNDAARLANIQNILDRKVVQIKGLDLTRPQIYAELKKLDAFKNATDC